MTWENITNNFTETNFIGPAQASYEEQQLYWGLAFLCTGMSVISLGFLIFESHRNKAFKTNMLRSFKVIINGDILFTACYFPYHSYNSVSALIGGIVSDPKDSPLCLVSWFFAANSVQLQFWGFALLGYAPLKMVNDSVNLRARGSLSQKSFRLAYSVSFASSMIWFFSGLAHDQLGSNRGLYCAASSWANFQGLWLFLTMVTSLSLFGAMFLLAFFRLKHMNKTSSAHAKGSPDSAGNTVSGQQSSAPQMGGTKTAAKAILKYGTIVVANFVIFWGLFALTSLWNALSPWIGSTPPLYLDLAAGVLAKVKPVADVLVIMSMPAVKKERNKRKNRNKVMDQNSSSKFETKGIQASNTAESSTNE